MKHWFSGLIAASLLCAPTQAATALKRGIYASSTAGCDALAKQDPEKRLPAEDIVSGEVRDTEASFLVIEQKTLGSADFECAIGKARRKGKATEWPLACEGESSGGRKSTMRSERAGTVIFAGGLKDWGITYFCR